MASKDNIYLTVLTTFMLYTAWIVGLSGQLLAIITLGVSVWLFIVLAVETASKKMCTIEDDSWVVVSATMIWCVDGAVVATRCSDQMLLPFTLDGSAIVLLNVVWFAVTTLLYYWVCGIFSNKDDTK